MGLFGKGNEKSPKDLVTEWTRKLRKEGYVIERQIKAIQREEEKSKRLLKDSAKKGEKGACSILAKEIIRSRKAVNRLYASKAHMNSVQMNMKNQLATLRIAGALAKSTDVMKSMQALIKLPEIQTTMMEMSKEMMKTLVDLAVRAVLNTDITFDAFKKNLGAGIMEEMMEDSMAGLEDEDEMEEEAQEEIDKVLFDLTAGDLGKAPTAVTDTLPAQPERAELEGATAAPVADEDEDDMMKRLEALRS